MILRLCSSAGKGHKDTKNNLYKRIILIIDIKIQTFDTMASKKAAHISIDQARWIDKAQAMAWVGVKTEAKFDEEWKPYLNLYNNGGKGGVYDKLQIDRVMEQRVEIKGQPYSTP